MDQNIACKEVVVCERTSIDDQSGLLSLHNLINHLFVNVTEEERTDIQKELKQVRGPMEVVLFWERTGEPGQELHEHCTVHFVDPHGAVIIDDMAAEVHAGADALKFYSIIKLGGLPCNGSGLHTFRILATDGKTGEKKPLYEEKFPISLVDENGSLVSADA